MTLTLTPNRESPAAARGSYTRLVTFERRGDFMVPVRRERNAAGQVLRVTELRWDRGFRRADREWPDLGRAPESDELRFARLEASWRAAGAPPLDTNTPDHSVRAYVGLRDGTDPIEA